VAHFSRETKHLPPLPLPYHLSALEGLDNGLDSGLVVTIYYLGRVHSSLTDNDKLGNIAEVHSVYIHLGLVWFGSTTYLATDITCPNFSVVSSSVTDPDPHTYGCPGSGSESKEN
jgi:hypothetical protein